MGPRIRKALLERFGTARAVLAAAPSELREVPRRRTETDARRSPAPTTRSTSRRRSRCAGEHGIEILTEGHAAYPRVLREIPDPPGVLFVRGEIKPDDALAIGIVGTRHGTQYGLRQAERLAGAWPGPD